jgi:hypothetical protein
MASVQTTAATVTGFVDNANLNALTGVVAGHTLVCWASTFGAGTGSSGVTDDKSNTWVKLIGSTGSGGEVSIWAAFNVAAGTTTINVNPTGPADVVCACAAEYDDNFTASPIDQTGSNAESGTTASVTAGGNTAQASELALAAMAPYSGANESFTDPSGWTVVVDQSDDTAQALSAVERYLSGVTTPSASWSFATSGSPTTALVTLKLAGGAKVPRRPGYALGTFHGMNRRIGRAV